ncbi:MAG: hypothetical protein AAB845_02150, partial [Patescibacteria group bacterium]
MECALLSVSSEYPLRRIKMQPSLPLAERYHQVWKRTLEQQSLGASDVAKSQFFFESDQQGAMLLQDGVPVPKRFDTYAIVGCLPFPAVFQQTLEDLWQEFMGLLGNPLAYGVELLNRHVEIFLFQRPGELFAQEEIEASIQASLPIAEALPRFTIRFTYPFMTPDGTIVVPGYAEPEEGVVDEFRDILKSTLTTYPQNQSQWLHTSLGRVLEPLSSEQLQPLLALMDAHQGEEIGRVEVGELLWTH